MIRFWVTPLVIPLGSFQASKGQRPTATPSPPSGAYTTAPSPKADHRAPFSSLELFKSAFTPDICSASSRFTPISLEASSRGHRLHQLAVLLEEGALDLTPRS